jgi:hypothetical protein
MSAKFQFARIKTYSAQPNKLATGEGGKAWSIADVEGEASRNELHCSHVLRPMSPQPIGLSIKAFSDVRATMLRDHDEAARAAGRPKPRGDRHTLMSVVASYPDAPEEINSSPTAKKRFRRWVAKTIRFVRRYFKPWGIRFKAFVIHVDESHFHIHCLGYAPGLPAGNVRLGHPGWVARYEALAAGATFKAASKIARAAYKTFGDAFHAAVGVEFGHLRVGRNLKRLSRAEALKAAEADLTAAKAIENGWTEVHKHAAEAKAIRTQAEKTAREKIEQANVEAAKVRADADQRFAAAETIHAEFESIEKQQQANVRAELEKLNRIGEVAAGALTRCAELEASQKSSGIDGAMLIKCLCERAATDLDPEASAKVIQISADILEFVKTELVTAKTAGSVEDLQQEVSDIQEQIKEFLAKYGPGGPT